MKILPRPQPFTVDDYVARMDGVATAAALAGLQGVLVAPGPDLVWLTGYQPTAITERLTVLVLAHGRAPVLVVPALERPDAKAAADHLQIMGWTDGSDPYETAAGLLLPGGRFAISDSMWSAHLLGLGRACPAATFQSLSEVLPLLRAIKDDNEIARLDLAGAAADEVYNEIVRLPFVGVRERDIATSLAQLLRAFGHDTVDFTIVGSGPNGANPHHQASDRIIEPGDAVVLDFGGLMAGYGSDTTRTVCAGRAEPELQDVHDIVRTAQQAAFEAVRPGVPCQEIDRVARDVITAAGYGEWFIHRTGHGIGVTTHEPPYLVKGEKHRLAPGMCFSIEPGIYLPGRFGVRIEDIVTVTQDGGRRLNNTGHALRVVH